MGFVDSVVQNESSGNASAKNPNSSALGPSQFINSTWLATLAKHRPDLTGTPDQLLALRTDPKLSAEMTAAYAADNAGILSKAGLPVNDGTKYLAHFAGPQGAVGILNADPSTPARSILGDAAVKANPFLATMTAGDVAAWSSRKMGGASAPLSIAGPQQPAAAPASVSYDTNPQAAPAEAAKPEPSRFAKVAAAFPDEAPQVAKLANILPPRTIRPIAPFSWKGYA